MEKEEEAWNLPEPEPEPDDLGRIDWQDWQTTLLS